MWGEDSQFQHGSPVIILLCHSEIDSNVVKLLNIHLGVSAHPPGYLNSASLWAMMWAHLSYLSDVGPTLGEVAILF